MELLNQPEGTPIGRPGLLEIKIDSSLTPHNNEFEILRTELLIKAPQGANACILGNHYINAAEKMKYIAVQFYKKS